MDTGLHHDSGFHRGFGRAIRGQLEKGERLVRKYRFFSKTKEERLDAGQKLLNVVCGVKRRLGKALQGSKRGKSQLKRYAQVARRKLESLHEAMERLAPQVQYWLDTGWVAKKKLVNLLMPEVCSVPRGKAGKDSEFGLKWGLTRLGGGFLIGSVDANRGNFNDKRHVIKSVDDCIRMFGAPPKSYAYDRGGYSAKNVEELARLGIKEVGLAPLGSAPWAVDDKTRRRLARERVKVEGCIGALKSGRYTFDRPNVRSTHMMTTCGQRSVLGYNLNRLTARLAEADGYQLAGA